MHPSTRGIRDEENQLLDAIRRMTGQIRRYDQHRESSAHREFLAEVIEHLQSELDNLRNGQRSSSLA